MREFPTRLLSSCAMAAYLVPAACFAAAADPAASFPNKPIRFIVPFAPGGGNDLVARLIANRLTETWGQQIIVDNRAGGGGVVGTEMTMKATPDGYTLMLAHSGTMAINPSLYRNVAYHPVRDFTPVAMVASSALVLVVHPSVQARSVKELIALAKVRPGMLNYASGGVGTGSHLSGEMFKSMAGLEMTHVSYKGTGPAVTDLIGGQVQMMFSVIPSAMPHVASKRLVALAVTGAGRSRMMESVPTVAESGLPGYESVLRYGVVGPRGLPAAVREKLSREILRIAGLEEFQTSLSKAGAEPVAADAMQYGKLIAQELAFWAKVVKAAGARGD